METIIAALISATASIVVCIITSNIQHNKLLSELKARDDMQAYRIEQLELKVDKHNNLIDRTYRLEEQATLMDEKMKVANRRIDDLEDKI